MLRASQELLRYAGRPTIRRGEKYKALSLFASAVIGSSLARGHDERALVDESRRIRIEIGGR